MTENAVKEFTVQTIYGEEVRLTAWNMTASYAAAAGGSVWLHLHDDPDEPPHQPDNDEDSRFFEGIGLDADAALKLGLALQLAAEKMLKGVVA